jgi:hypothetical protein
MSQAGKRHKPEDRTVSLAKAMAKCVEEVVDEAISSFVLLPSCFNSYEEWCVALINRLAAASKPNRPAFDAGQQIFSQRARIGAELKNGWPLKPETLGLFCSIGIPFPNEEPMRVLAHLELWFEFLLSHYVTVSHRFACSCT